MNILDNKNNKDNNLKKDLYITKKNEKDNFNNKNFQAQNRAKGFSESKLADSYKKTTNNTQHSGENNKFEKIDIEKKVENNKAQNNNQKNIKPFFQDKEDDIKKIVIGLNEKKNKIFIPESSRFLNTLILGITGTGKTEEALPTLLEQDLKNKDYGCTIIVSKNEMAYKLYALAKQYRKDVIILKPSISNEIANKFLWANEYNYDYINENIINYKEAIKKKNIVIIDMEILKHKSDGLKAVAMLLLQLQLDMQETDITQKSPHFLYVDDGQYYIPFLEHLFAFGNNYNLAITLFLQSRSQLIKNGKDYSSIVDNNIRNIILLNALERNDINYYKERLYEYKQLNDFYNRKTSEILYEIVGTDNKRKCGIADYNLLKTIDWESINNKAKSYRSKLLKKKRKELEKKILASIKKNFSENKEYEYKEEEENLGLSNEENICIATMEKELIDVVGMEDLEEELLEMNEPIPINLSEFEEDKLDKEENEINTKDLSIETHIQELKKETVKEEKKEIEKIKSEKIKEIIKVKEKATKRNVSTKIFNNLVKGIDYCDDNFDFHYE